MCLDIVHDENITKFIEVLASGKSPRTLTYMAHIVFNLVKDGELSNPLSPTLLKTAHRAYQQKFVSLQTIFLETLLQRKVERKASCT